MGIEGNPQNLSAHSSDPQDDGNGTTEEHPKNSEAGKQIFETKNESGGLRNFSDQELATYTETFLGKEVIELSQEDVDTKLKPLLSEIAQREIDAFALFAFALPRSVSEEEIQSGNSSWAKVYRSLFNFSKETGYKQDPAFQRVTSTLESVVGQDPQMIGPVALWETAKDVMWRKDVPSHAKGDLMSSMTYILAFSDTKQYEVELLKHLDFENTENYAEVAHMLEAIKQFWSSGHESYAENSVPAFYLHALRKIKETPEANYLLSVRAQEILSILEHSDLVPNEAVDIRPFELSKGIYASTQVDEGLTVVPEEKNKELKDTVDDFNINEEQITPPQWMIDEALARGETWVEWQPPNDLILERKRLYHEMHKHATIPIEEKLGELGDIDNEKQQGLLFDYEYLVSRPVREMIQREFDFELKDLSIREQFYFLNYLKKTTSAEVDTVKSFITTYGTKGMRTFLSLENGDESLGDEIVEFANRENTLAEKVFSYYGELLDSAEKAEQIIHELSGEKETVDTELIDNVRKNILGRAQKDLEKAVREENTEKLEQMVSGYVTHAKKYVALLQEVGVGESIESRKPEELSEAEKEEMLATLQMNYDEQYPDPEDAKFKAKIRETLEYAFSNPNTTFKLLRDQGRIVSFHRFDTLTDATGREVTTFGSFNVNPTYSGVGTVMFERTTEEQLQDSRPMLGYCDPKQAITKKYIESGFIATELKPFERKPSFEIWRTQDIRTHFMSKNETLEDLLSYEEKEGAPYVVRKQTREETYPELHDEKVLTRYFTHNDNTYLVFEKIPEELQVVLKGPNS